MQRTLNTLIGLVAVLIAVVVISTVIPNPSQAQGTPRPDPSLTREALIPVTTIQMTTTRIWNDPVQGRLEEGVMVFQLSDATSFKIDFIRNSVAPKPTPVGFKTRR